jgi:hypothetical protein
MRFLAADVQRVGHGMLATWLDRDAEGFGHRSHRLDPVGRPFAEKVEILRRWSRHKPAQDEVAAPDEDDLVVEPASLEQLPECPQRCLKLGSTD